MDRYIGQEIKLNPKFNETKFIWIKREDWDSGNKHMCNPAFWFENNGCLEIGWRDNGFQKPDLRSLLKADSAPSLKEGILSNPAQALQQQNTWDQRVSG